MARAKQLLSAIKQAEFPHLENLIHVFIGGSELHGAKIKDTDDLDIYGAYLEPPELILGLESSEFFVWSTARGTSGETGLTTLISVCTPFVSGPGWRPKAIPRRCISCPRRTMRQGRSHGKSS